MPNLRELKLSTACDRIKSRLRLMRQKARVKVHGDRILQKTSQATDSPKTAQEEESLRKRCPHLPTELWIHILSFVETVTLWTSCRLVSHNFHAIAEEVAKRHCLTRLCVLVCHQAIFGAKWHQFVIPFNFHHYVPEEPARAVFYEQAMRWNDAKPISKWELILSEERGWTKLAIEPKKHYNKMEIRIWRLMRSEPSRIYFGSNWDILVACGHEMVRGGRNGCCTLTVDWKKMMNAYAWRLKDRNKTGRG